MGRDREVERGESGLGGVAKPLEGLRVLDLSHVIAGPLASFYLAQMGAEVVKIESPQGGEVMRAQRGAGAATDTPDGFVALNAGKKSLAIDIRPSARAAPSLGADNDEILAKLEAEMAGHPTTK